MSRNPWQFLLPDLGEGLTEAEVVRWLVNVGDDVSIDQVIVEVETAKASVQIPSPIAGIVERLHGEVGDVLFVGAPLISFVRYEGPESVAASTECMDVAGCDPQDDASGNVLVGYGTRSGRTRRRRGEPDDPNARAVEVARQRPTVLSPVIRRLARVEGVDLTQVKGTGPGGLILRRDVEAASAALSQQTERSAMRSPDPAETDQTSKDGVRTVQLTSARRTAAIHLARSRREIPEATVWVDVDASRLLATRRDLNRDEMLSPVSILGLVSRFVTASLKVHMELNASFDAETQSLLYHDDINLGFAAQTEAGLVVPVVHGAGDMNARQLSHAIKQLTEVARAGQLKLASLTGGTCTVNNYGVFDVDGSAAIINHPESAMIGIGRILKRPWVIEDEIVVRPVTELTLSFDHRVCDGATASSFLRFIRDCIAEPATLLGQI